jgi:Ca2+/H+ antiporter
LQQQDQQLPLLTQSSQPLFSCLDSLLSPQQKKHTKTSCLLACFIPSIYTTTTHNNKHKYYGERKREREFGISISVVVMYLLGTVIGRRTLDGVETAAAAAQNSNHDKDEDDDNDSPKHKAISIIIIIII